MSKEEFTTILAELRLQRLSAERLGAESEERKAALDEAIQALQDLRGRSSSTIEAAATTAAAIDEAVDSQPC